jgi:hypothetical protein
MTDDEFQRHVTFQASEAIGEWLMSSHLLDRQVRTMKRADLEAMAAAAIARFVKLASERHAAGTKLAPAMELLLFGSASALSA